MPLVNERIQTRTGGGYPPKLAHGFVTLSETAEFLYKTTVFYAPAFKRCIAWDDPTIAVDWHFPGVPRLTHR
ncbi:MAG: dTDP-4-dehydrorhamnose 3,5-epimerase family protein [Azonexus sp.]|nr:dTDP-4-dehydrorhamnose 3,5-epimerase family protein [Azonexus sp.]MDZ4314236.1 dTDP-4-dehydrorhamnose 3,5-epimerase family protein [Azonexus sp.]